MLVPKSLCLREQTGQSEQARRFDPFFRLAAKGGDSSNTVLFVRQNLSEIAGQQGYPKLIVNAMIDRNPEIVLVQDQNKAASLRVHDRRGVRGRAEKEGPAAAKDAHSQAVGLLPQRRRELGKEFAVASKTVNNPSLSEVYALYGLTEKEHARFQAQPGSMISQPFSAPDGNLCPFGRYRFHWAYPRSQNAGGDYPGLVSLVLFVLFFWANAYANGQTIFLAVALFVLGLILLGVEIFVLPGFWDHRH